VSFKGTKDKKDAVDERISHMVDKVNAKDLMINGKFGKNERFNFSTDE
jgi:hypothetical protein